MSVLSRNHLTTPVNSDVSKLTNRDIQRIIRQLVKERPVVEIAQYFQITRQRVYQLVDKYTRAGNIRYFDSPRESLNQLMNEWKI
jgi:hypothetical protein